MMICERYMFTVTVFLMNCYCYFYHCITEGSGCIPESAILLEILFHTFYAFHDVSLCFALGARRNHFCQSSAVHHLALQVVPTFVIAARFWRVRRVGCFLVYADVRV